ncbi:UDP-galactopyranose mutase [Lactobacillus sp. 3B(2020)]|uniref:UDP-galactopyranose mutase n=1 Tax=Lactobacillus sp. 3B(2020) TaxID=2695882 RepID=UPI0015DE7593|nr:UDP-galactopyranose mutase [Lactobacillus sp. 3B(2020)]QLL69457.1 UDP-galactopyranose mutase [Lactobacillus sp. 3B(2020)]
MSKYDYLVVGAGLFGATFAYEAAKRGKRVKVIEKRDHIAGNIYTKEEYGIQVHQYGAHIFHTSNKEIWDYVNQFAEFNRYTNSPIANYKGEIYNLPFNMNTFSKMWGVKTPAEAQAKIDEQRQEMAGKQPANLEEQAISLIGRDIYEKLVKGYTEKQWGQKATDLPAFIIRRLPVRLTYDNNYFNDLYQGIPVGGYTQIVEKMLASDLIDVETGVDYFDHQAEYEVEFPKIVFTGMIDQYFGYQLGELQYRSLRFETEVLDEDNHQGNAVVNYTDAETPYTRIIEHKHFEFGKGDQGKTVITKEYPADWQRGDEPYYPVNNATNNSLYKQYAKLATETKPNVIFGGRLGQYRYYDMDQVLHAALVTVAKEFGK